MTMLNRIDMGTGKRLRFAPGVDNRFRRTIYVNVPRIQIDFSPDCEPSPVSGHIFSQKEYYLGKDWAYEGDLPQFVNDLPGWSNELQGYVSRFTILILQDLKFFLGFVFVTD
ncbi:hypothetical protein FBUS_01914 [Fasciolopsis buskii]|uniref:Uncharacterized protein n=1 Tax=Fasciolopsis buskii TaxID=27845 RepID=A0A8E0RV19_9TREM|nr:hypothetical protein FBUS_01914 [Fasciolopsis buski]